MGEDLPHDFLLCNEPEVRVSRYKEMKRLADREGLAAFLKGRFEERYLGKAGNDIFAPSAKTRGASGFAVAASSCLTIEALEAFRNGWTPNTTHGREAFVKFFARHPELGAAEDVSCGKAGRRVNCPCFYHGIRCSILHSGETTGGWRLHTYAERTFDKANRILNPTKLRQAVRQDLGKYADLLRKSAWGPTDKTNPWRKFVHRMDWTVRHCRFTPLGGEGEASDTASA